MIVGFVEIDAGLLGIVRATQAARILGTWPEVAEPKSEALPELSAATG